MITNKKIDKEDTQRCRGGVRNSMFEGQKVRKNWVISGGFCRRRKPTDGESETKAACLSERVWARTERGSRMSFTARLGHLAAPPLALSPSLPPSPPSFTLKDSVITLDPPRKSTTNSLLKLKSQLNSPANLASPCHIT